MNLLEFGIVHKSLEITEVDSFENGVPLLCLSSFHGKCEYLYVWRMSGSATKRYPDTPVIYVDKPGIYQCNTCGMTEEQSLTDFFEVKMTGIQCVII